MSDSPNDLEPLVADLAETLETLERRLDAEPRRRQTLLRFTEEYAIPTTVAVLEANIRVLEAVGGAIRMAEGREPRERTRWSQETALSALDRALSEVSGAVSGTPTDPEARELLSEARSLRDEIQSRVDASSSERGTTPATDSSGGTTIPVAEQRGSDRGPDGPADGVDVDAELDTIRKEVHGDQKDGNGRGVDSERGDEADQRDGTDDEQADDGGPAHDAE